MTQDSRFAFLPAYVISITRCVLKVYVRVSGACIDNIIIVLIEDILLHPTTPG